MFLLWQLLASSGMTVKNSIPLKVCCFISQGYFMTYQYHKNPVPEAQNGIKTFREMEMTTSFHPTSEVQLGHGFPWNSKFTEYMHYKDLILQDRNKYCLLPFKI